MLRRIVPALAVVALFTGCEQLCKVLARVTPVVARATQALDLAVPALAPSVAAEYNLIRSGLDEALAAGTAACNGSDDAAKIQAAADAATALLEFYRAHQPTVARALEGRRATLPSDADVDEALAQLRRAK